MHWFTTNSFPLLCTCVVAPTCDSSQLGMCVLHSTHCLFSGSIAIPTSRPRHVSSQSKQTAVAQAEHE